jgi:hypothetical protein
MSLIRCFVSHSRRLPCLLCCHCINWYRFVETIARAGVPLEVMGLMLGEFVDEYTVQCVDVFAMPQSGTSVSVESVDPVFQQQMMEMLKQTGRCARYRNLLLGLLLSRLPDALCGFVDCPQA